MGVAVVSGGLEPVFHGVAEGACGHPVRGREAVLDSAALLVVITLANQPVAQVRLEQPPLFVVGIGPTVGPPLDGLGFLDDAPLRIVLQCVGIDGMHACSVVLFPKVVSGNPGKWSMGFWA